MMRNLHVLPAVYDARFNYRFTDDCLSLLWGCLRTTLLFATLQGSQERTVDVCAIVRISYYNHHCTNSDVYTYILQILTLYLYTFGYIGIIQSSFHCVYCLVHCAFILFSFHFSYFIQTYIDYRLFMRTRATFSTNRPSSVIEASEFCLFMWA